MRFVAHPNVVDFIAFFYSNADKVCSSLSGVLRRSLELISQKDEVYLNLVLEYMPEIMPMLQVKLYMYQVSRIFPLRRVASPDFPLCRVV
jgi:glycogen synthase kinase 3 beta